MVNTVNMTPRTSRPQHPDGVAAALLAAGTALAREGGPEAVVLREATRRVQVSPAAAYRHFADHRALLGAVGAVAMSELAEAMELGQPRVDEGDPAELARLRLRAVGAGYLRYARDEPGLFRTAFATVEEVGHADEGRGRSGLTPLELLTAALDGLVEVGRLPARRRPGAELVAWSAVHGLATLLHGPLRGLDDDEVHEVSAQLLDTIERGLLSTGSPGASEAAVRRGPPAVGRG